MTASAPAIARLGHVGIHVTDVDRAVRFYRDVLGLQVTDQDPEIGMVFMSARPDEEHHELVILPGRTAPPGTTLLQQISFRCDSLEDVRAFHRRLKEHNVPLDMEVSHGNAVGIYFYDPEGNRVEVYWATGLKARQPYLQGVDLDKPAETIFDEVEASVRAHGEAGIIDFSLLEKQDIGTPQQG